jgi:hypothetical protein
MHRTPTWLSINILNQQVTGLSRPPVRHNLARIAFQFNPNLASAEGLIRNLFAVPTRLAVRLARW